MKTVSRIYMFLIFLFLYAPIVVLIVFSFNGSTVGSRSVFSGFSFRWYDQLFQDGMLLAALRNTLVIAVVAAVVSTVLGTAAAIGIGGMNKWMRRAVMNVTNFPMVNPDIVTGVSLMLLFVAGTKMLGGASLGMVSLILAHITFCLPYVILSVMPKLRQMDPNLSEAAQDLGCPPSSAFLPRRAAGDHARHRYRPDYGVHALDRRFRGQLFYKRNDADAADFHLFDDAQACQPGNQRAFHAAVRHHPRAAPHHQHAHGERREAHRSFGKGGMNG